MKCFISQSIVSFADLSCAVDKEQKAQRVFLIFFTNHQSSWNNLPKSVVRQSFLGRKVQKMYSFNFWSSVNIYSSKLESGRNCMEKVRVPELSEAYDKLYGTNADGMRDTAWCRTASFEARRASKISDKQKTEPNVLDNEKRFWTENRKGLLKNFSSFSVH